LLQDFHLIDKLSHFDAERIPERVVHAKGAGAHGYFEVTSKDISKICKAKFLSSPGKKTPIFLRFSTVGGEKGSADTERDPRGFAIKFYTEEGILLKIHNLKAIGTWSGTTRRSFSLGIPSNFLISSIPRRGTHRPTLRIRTCSGTFSVWSQNLFTR
jgi:hypothetical protein